METFAGIEVLTALEERISPQHTALLVIDMQNDYCSPEGATDRNGWDLSGIRAIIPTLGQLIDTARGLGIPIMFTRYTVGPGPTGWSGAEILRRGTIFARVQATVKGTWGHELIAEMPYRAEEDLVIDKRRPSSFVGTDLDLCLRGKGIKTLVVTGVATPGCVESTVRDAVGLDYYVAVPRDCVASIEQVGHERALLSIADHLRYSEGVTSSDRIRGIWTLPGPDQGEAPLTAAPLVS